MLSQLAYLNSFVIVANPEGAFIIPKEIRLFKKKIYFTLFDYNKAISRLHIYTKYSLIIQKVYISHHIFSNNNNAYFLFKLKLLTLIKQYLFLIIKFFRTLRLLHRKKKKKKNSPQKSFKMKIIKLITVHRIPCTRHQ